jgi:hypothetical protein
LAAKYVAFACKFSLIPPFSGFRLNNASSSLKSATMAKDVDTDTAVGMSTDIDIDIVGILDTLGMLDIAFCLLLYP